MGVTDTDRKARLQREIEHHRKIAARAEAVWNWDSAAGRRRADRRAELFVEHGDLRPGRRALELGCGTGVFLERVAPCGAEIRGIDLSEDLLEKARARLARFANVALDHRIITRLERADVDDHINFVCAIFDGLRGLKDLAFSRVRAKREADDRRDLHVRAVQELPAQADPIRVHAHGDETKLLCLVA